MCFIACLTHPLTYRYSIIAMTGVAGAHNITFKLWYKLKPIVVPIKLVCCELHVHYCNKSLSIRRMTSVKKHSTCYDVQSVVLIQISNVTLAAFSCFRMLGIFRIYSIHLTDTLLTTLLPWRHFVVCWHCHRLKGDKGWYSNKLLWFRWQQFTVTAQWHGKRC